MLPVEGGRISSWEGEGGGGRGSSKLSRGPLSHPCLFFPDPERKSGEGGKKDTLL